MEFKVGDRIRLTGRGWYGDGEPAKGEVYTITGTDEFGNSTFDAFGYPWYVDDEDYTAEPVEIQGGDPVEIQVGDRVRATSKINDDIAEFTVVGRYGSTVTSSVNAYYTNDFDFEVITPALPTEPGVYASSARETDVREAMMFLLDADGSWHLLDLSACAYISPAPIEVVAKFAATLVKAFG